MACYRSRLNYVVIRDPHTSDGPVFTKNSLNFSAMISGFIISFPSVAMAFMPTFSSFLLSSLNHSMSANRTPPPVHGSVFHLRLIAVLEYHTL